MEAFPRRGITVGDGPAERSFGITSNAVGLNHIIVKLLAAEMRGSKRSLRSLSGIE